MHIWPGFEVHQESLLTFDLLDWRPVSRICVLLSPLVGDLRISIGKLPTLLPDSPELGHWCFKMPVRHFPSWENGSSWLCHLQSADYKFEARLKIFKLLKLRKYPVERWHCCSEWLWQFGNSVNNVMEFCKTLVVCQLVKGHQNLVCFDRRRGILTAELRLTGRVVVFLLSLRCTRGAVSYLLVNSCHHVVAVANLFRNSCHHVVAIFWARVLRHLVVQNACFRIRILLGVVLIRSLACTQCVPGPLRSGSRMALI